MRNKICWKICQRCVNTDFSLQFSWLSGPPPTPLRWSPPIARRLVHRCALRFVTSALMALLAIYVVGRVVAMLTCSSSFIWLFFFCCWLAFLVHRFCAAHNCTVNCSTMPWSCCEIGKICCCCVSVCFLHFLRYLERFFAVQLFCGKLWLDGWMVGWCSAFHCCR